MSHGRQNRRVYDGVSVLRCRFTELSQSLALYGLDPDTKLKSPRAQLDPSERTFESSNYRVLMDAEKKRHMEKEKMASWLILRAVEELIKIYAPKNWAKSFVTELVQSKKHKGGDIGKIAQYLCECAVEESNLCNFCCTQSRSRHQTSCFVVAFAVHVRD